jgi:hypothetical protein
MKGFHNFNIDKPITYDGTQLRHLFNYEQTGYIGDSIYSFIGPMELKETLVDMEDVLNNDFIWSPLAVNFIVQMFNISIETMVLYQRWLMYIITDTVREFSFRVSPEDDKRIYLNGDDIMVIYREPECIPRKLSVSIATGNANSGLIHSGINLKVDSKIPVPAIGLLEIIDNDDLEEFIIKVTDRFGKIRNQYQSD